MPETPFKSAVALSHFLLAQRIRPGDRVADLTCGNGHDTLFLAELVGEHGKVWAFDLQDRAIEATRARLSAAGRLDRVELIAAGHERIGEFVSSPLSAAICNLGYLPGGDKELVTRPATTLAALTGTLALLSPGGLLCVCVYPGHPGGDEEARAVDHWLANLPASSCHTWNCRQPNRSNASPYVLILEKVN